MTSRPATLVTSSPRRFLRRPLAALVIFLIIVGTGVAGCGVIGGGNQLPPNTPVVPSGLSGRLVMPREGALVSLDLPTGQLQQLAPQPSLGGITSARWSPDGSQVAYARFDVRDQRVPVSELWLVQADGSGARIVLPAEQGQTYYQAPVWDPSGTSLFFLYTGMQGTEQVHRIERLTLTTGARETVIDEQGAFDVAPDGGHLALVRSVGGNVSLVVFDLSTGQQRELIAPGAFSQLSAPRFDPTSTTILFAATGSGNARSGLAPSRPSDLGALLVPSALAHGDPQDIWSIAAAGDTPTRRIALQGDDPTEAWSPDGSQIAILATEALGIAPAAGGKPTSILYPGGSGSVDWATLGR